MKKSKITNLDILGITPETENNIPENLKDLNVQSGPNIEINDNTITVRNSSEYIAGGLFYWKDVNNYWHLTTTGIEPIIEYVDNEYGQTAVIETRNYIIQPNPTGETAII